MIYLKDFFKRNYIFILFIIILFLFSLILKHFYSYELYLFDENIYLNVFNIIISNNMTTFMKIITNFGSTLFLSIMIIIIFLYIKNKKISINLVYSLLITYVFNNIFKKIFMRERPMYSLIKKPSNYSFPSSHAMCSTVFYGLVIYYVIKNIKNDFIRWFLTTILILLILFIGISRIYLRAHYFSDVMFGILFGVLFIFIIINEIKE